MRYLELLGKPVVAADGTRLGRVTELLAEPRQERLCVSGLRVGPASLLRRVAFKRSGAIPLGHSEIPWRLVARIDDRIHLSVDGPTAANHMQQEHPVNIGAELPE